MGSSNALQILGLVALHLQVEHPERILPTPGGAGQMISAVLAAGRCQSTGACREGEAGAGCVFFSGQHDCGKGCDAQLPAGSSFLLL